jgi:hypothetical protein
MTEAASRASVIVTTPPAGEKLIAFSSTLMNTWMRRSSDAFTSHGSAGEFNSIETFPRIRNPSTILSSSPRTSTRVRNSVVNRASIIVISRTPARSDSILAISSSTMRRKRRRCSCSSTSASISVAVRIDASGFLNSCETSAANDSMNRTYSSSRRVKRSRARERSPISSCLREPRKRPRGEQARFLPQRASLQSEEFLLVRAEVEDPGDRQENQQEIERHEAERDAREKAADAIGDPLHGSPRSTAGSAAGPPAARWRYVGHATHR